MLYLSVRNVIRNSRPTALASDDHSSDENRAASPSPFSRLPPALETAEPVMSCDRLTLAYWQIGSPSVVALPPNVMEQVFDVPVLVAFAAQPVVVTLESVTVTPGEDA